MGEIETLFFDGRSLRYGLCMSYKNRDLDGVVDAIDSNNKSLYDLLMKVKLMSYQEDILKKICCDSEGMIGCNVSLGNAARLLQLGLVHLAPTRAGIEYLTGSQVLTVSQVESWVRGIQIREGKLKQSRANKQGKSQSDMQLVYAAEDAARR